MKNFLAPKDLITYRNVKVTYNNALNLALDSVLPALALRSLLSRAG